MLRNIVSARLILDGKNDKYAELSVQERVKVDDLLLFLAHTSSGIADEPFFNTLARYLGLSLSMDFVYIDRLEGDGLSARTLAVWCDGHFEDNVTYALKDTPCGDVVGKEVCCFPASVSQLFPSDEVLKDLRAESYVGVTLWGYSGQPIGLIAVIGRTSLQNPVFTETVLKLVAQRAAGELERLDAEIALANSERFLNAIIDSEPDCIKLLDIDGNLLMMNRAGLEMIEADSFEQVKGLCVCLLITEAYRDAFVNLIKQVFLGVSGTLEFESIGLKGGRVWLETQAVPFRNELGKITALLGITRNVTEQKKLEDEKVVLQQQLQQSQRLESLGVLAGGIAHDFNNILQVIIGGCSLIMMDHAATEKFIPTIENAVVRAAELCRQMLAYAGKAPFVVTQVNLGTFVGDLVTMLQTTLNKNVMIRFDNSSVVPCIKSDVTHLNQIVLSLINNAIEAIGEAQGEIVVSLSKWYVSVDRPENDFFGKNIPAGCYLCLQVTDNGCGMDDNTKLHIFEPFYTTKFTGRGLGMSAVIGIIEAHKGAVQLLSQPAQGTTVKVYLPVDSSESAGDKSIQEATLRPWQGVGTILLVEDEEVIRTTLRSMLEMLGYRVIEAANGREALEMYQKNIADITVVVTDIGMPLMDGYELFGELKKLAPKLPIIVSSGFGDTIITSRIPREEIAGLISKPYSFDQLRELLKSFVAGQ